MGPHGSGPILLCQLLTRPGPRAGGLLGGSLSRLLQIGDQARGLFRKAGVLAQLLRDLRNLLRRVVRSEHSRLSGQVAGRYTLGRILEDDEIFAGLWIGTVENRWQLLIVLEREPVQPQVIASFDV